MWFEETFGFRETDPATVRATMKLDGTRLTSRANGRVFRCGELTTPSLADLRARAVRSDTGRLRMSEIIGDVQALHQDPANALALFQVASQFNLLEMLGPEVPPEAGIDRYDTDHTQGPACAIACGAATLYRNYLVPHGPAVGQTDGHQVDCLSEIGQALGNEGERLWTMQNGYALPTDAGLHLIDHKLWQMTDTERDKLRGLLRVGMVQDAEVTLGACDHTVSQAFCSALPVSYSPHAPQDCESFARLILEASYEAFFHLAWENARSTGCNKVFVTLLGGGAFGNRAEWITGALQRALDLFRSSDMDVYVVSYGRSNPAAADLVGAWP